MKTQIIPMLVASDGNTAIDLLQESIWRQTSAARGWRRASRRRDVHQDEFCGSIKKKWEWSGRKDLNLRPPGPEPGALARLRYAPTIKPTQQGVYARMPRLATHQDHPISSLGPKLE
jgi:hypothetical protein